MAQWSTSGLRLSLRKRGKKKKKELSANGQDKKGEKVEEAFTRACLARVQAFGFGEVAFSRGDLSASTAWFSTGLSTLEQGPGLKRWKLSVKVYLEGSRILFSPLTAGAVETIDAARNSLDELKILLDPLHRGYAALGGAFANLARVRLAQVQTIQGDQTADALQVDGLGDITVVDPRTSSEGGETVTSISRSGPRSAILALILLTNSEVLLRSKKNRDCREVINHIRDQFPSTAFAQVEIELLEAQLAVVDGDWKRAIRVLERERNLDFRANRNQRALWFALASKAHLELKNTLSARMFATRARAIGRHIRHGFVSRLVHVTVGRAIPDSVHLRLMPYQEEPPKLSLDLNAEAWIRNLVQTALDQNDSIRTREELGRALEISTSVAYAKIDKRIVDELIKSLPDNSSGRTATSVSYRFAIHRRRCESARRKDATARGDLPRDKEAGSCRPPIRLRRH
jgi:hypothetical protein